MQNTIYYWDTVSIKNKFTVLYNAFYPSEILVFKFYQVKIILGFIVCTFDLWKVTNIYAKK